MADILPFRALQFSPDRVPLERVVTQPYDKITPEMQARYRAGHPKNIVRIIRPADEPDTPEGVSPYRQAAGRLEEWRRAGILRQSEEPAVFAYFQRFAVPGRDEVRVRKGFIALTRLADYAERVIFPHERTLSGPKQDRLELLRATRTHFGQVFLLYSDPDGTIDSILDAVSAERAPEARVEDESAVEHSLWRISSGETVAAIQQAMRSRPAIIADGHHRYETALAFRDEQREALKTPDAGPAEWVMTTLVNMEAPGLVILPTHRVLAGLAGFDPRALARAAGEYFDIVELARPEALDAALAGHRAAPAIGVAAGDPLELRLFVLKEGVDPARLFPQLSSRQSRLDVVVLHRLILDRCLGITEAAVRGERYIAYLRGAEEAVERVRSGGAQAAFLLKATRVDQVRDIALAGEVLPQKSTDFFPKLLTGLAMYSMA